MRFAAILCLLAVAALLSQPPEIDIARVGPLGDGSVLLPSGWLLKPAGRQLPLDTLPMSTALSPDGRFLLVLNGGYNPPSVSVINLETTTEIQRVPVADGWLGLAFTPNGRLVYVGGGSRASILEFTFSPEGKLEPARTFEIVPEAQRTVRDFIGDVAVSPDARLLYATSLYQDKVLIVNPQSGRVIEEIRTARRPYRILFHPDGKSFFVSSWADGVVQQREAETGRPIGLLRVGPHPTDMLWSDKKAPAEEGAEPEWNMRLFVAAAHTNSVYVFGGNASQDLRLVETINVAMTPRQPLGMTPSALALNADQTRLYVVCSDANAVAVADVSQTRSRILGFLPTGWYPTAARMLPDKRLVVLNGKGLRSHANPRGPSPTRRPAPASLGNQAPQYVAAIQTGTAAFIDPFGENELEAYTKTVFANSPYRDQLLDHARIPVNNPVPSTPDRKSPIEHVVYIVKENRTYDQVLGGLGKGNGDPSLVLFGESVTPNQHKMAREFVLFDNFYVSADVSADGHAWSTAAIAPDYTQKQWPNSYAQRRRLNDYHQQDPASLAPAGYLWTQALARGLSVRNYGYVVENKAKPGQDGIQVESVRDASLRAMTNSHFRGFDTQVPDLERAQVFLRDLAGFEANNNLPRLIVMRLGGNHTSGTTPGRISPQSAVADNDYALGLIVDALSRGKFWSKMAIFVLEDDAQNGADHVDAHRSPAFILSPYTRRGILDSTMYNTTSMLRTMELILGLRPMTHFDAAARPMHTAFEATPDARPYTAEKPRIPLDQRNPANSPTAARSLRLDFSEEDRIDDDELNDILWLAIRGTEPPAPVRSYFGR
ncbi:MAG: bifunctional YncE family protein/alkaline phosphatase family protein [Acidobacteria bacterium]|nr:bifunctional YncE family protein/alkaline phosphatase family protein [Acidobacteriota bacterium]